MKDHIKLQKKPVFSILIKPNSYQCNLKCDYCFYLKKNQLYGHHTYMTFKTAERLIAAYLNHEQEHYTFIWQGGEPTLMGLDFYQQVVRLQQKYGRPGMTITNALQTNATLISKSFADFFNKYHFLIGVSLDGPASVHDAYRLSNGKGSFQQSINGIKTLQSQGMVLNNITAVHKKNVHLAKELFSFFIDNGIYYHQYVPIVEFDKNGTPLPFTITAKEWGTFLCTLYDCWYPEHTRKVSVRLFDSIINYLVYGQKNSCAMENVCSQYLAVEWNGDIYPCDFFVEKETKLGNIMQNSWSSIFQLKKYKQFTLQKKHRNKQCHSCAFQEFCMGDCPKNRFYPSANPKNLSWLCEGWQMFYEYSLPCFYQIADKLKE